MNGSANNYQNVVTEDVLRDRRQDDEIMEAKNIGQVMIDKYEPRRLNVFLEQLKSYLLEERLEKIKITEDKLNHLKSTYEELKNI